MLDTLALVGEVLSWVGLGLGLPMLLIAVLIRTIEGPWLPAEIAIIERDGALLARWFAGGDFHERPLSRQESATAEAGWADGVVSANNPSPTRAWEGLFAGLVVSLLPLLWS